jgi:hypothetical protein
VWDSSAKNLYLYLNGALVATQNVPVNIPDSAAGDATHFISLGNNSPFTDPLQGTIDDARVWNRALSAGEVLALYNATSGGGCAPVGLAGWWKFDEGSGTTTADSSGNGNTGTLVNNGSGLPTWTTSGKINNALVFSTTTNTASNEVDAGNSASLQITGSMTVTAWVYKTASLTFDGRIVYRRDSGTIPFALKTTNDCGQLNFAMEIVNGTAATEPCSKTVVQTNTWYFVTAVYDQSVPIVHIYVNGVLDDGGNGYASPIVVPSSLVASTAHLAIGGDNFTNSGFTGTIDDPRVYNRALSAAEIRALYNGISGGVEGDSMYNATSHIPQFCDGTAWHASK